MDSLDPRLAQWADHIERLQWSALLVDADWRLAWVSTELQAFIGGDGTVDLGLGRHVVEALTMESWLGTLHQDSQVELFSELAPLLLSDFLAGGRDPADVLPERLQPLLAAVTPVEPPSVWSGSFRYVDPRGDAELSDYRVNLMLMRLHDETGGPLGWMALFVMGVRPNLLALLGRGDERMYERMARLVEPGPREGAILFCDLQASGEISRRLPSAAYFKLIRRLWSAIDAIVASNTGIVGKHAGDGACAYFLVDDLGDPSSAALAAIRTARGIHEVSEEIFASAMGSDCLMTVGLHWGAGTYMGQLVPGGRLDVTALGDEMNHAARVQEASTAGETLASKPLVERLSAEDAAAAGIDPEKLTYRTLAERAPDAPKIVRDAGGIPVVPL